VTDAPINGVDYESDVAAALDFAARNLATVELYSEGTRTWWAHGADVQISETDSERHQLAPNAKRGELTMHTGESFARYVNDHDEGPATALYADVRSRSVTGIIDGHALGSVLEDAKPGWAEHRVVLALRHTYEWEQWSAKSGQLLAPLDFASFLEDRVLEIIEPDSATMLELAQSFHANVTVDFKKAERLDNGETQFRFEEKIDARAGRTGEIDVPSTFTLALAPFEGDDPQPVTARLRYRLRDGHLTIGYTIANLEETVRASFDRVLEQIEADTDKRAYRGAAPPKGR
jgi:uncharacterized protein YfdQ (DUF2303 family)